MSDGHWPGSRLLLPAVLAVAFLLRAGYVLTTNYGPLVWDQLNYTNLAVQWLDKGVYAYMDTVPNTLVTPGYPVFLAAVFAAFGHVPLEPALMIVRFLQAAFGTAAVGLIYLCGLRLFNRTAGMLAALIAAFYPTYIWSPALITTETIFSAFLLALVYRQARILQRNRWRDHVWYGLLLGAAVLIRPNVLPLAVVPYLLLWIHHRKPYAGQAVCAAGLFAVVMLPWWIRNGITFHKFIFLSDGGAGNPFLGGTDPYFRGTIDWSRIDPQRQFAAGWQRIKQGLQDDPWLWIRWFTVGKFSVLFKTPYLSTLPHVLAKLFYVLHIVFTALGWLTLLSFRNRGLSLLAVNLLIYLAVQLLFVPDVRYSYGMYPFIMLGFAYLLSGVIHRFAGYLPSFRKRTA